MNDRKAIRAANKRTNHSNEACYGMISAVSFIGTIALILWLLLGPKAPCAWGGCPGYACQTNSECATCVCAIQTGQAWGVCVDVSMEEGK